MNINIFIPTFPRDFEYLNKIIELYMIGNKKPLKLIISVGSYKDEYKKFFDNIEKKYNNVIIIRDREKLLAAESRNKAKNYECDVVVFHDSDDYPHYDRLKIIEYYFNKYPDVMHIHHNYTREYEFNDIEIDNIEIETSDKIYNYYFPNNDYKFGSKISKEDNKQSHIMLSFPVALGVGAYKMEVLKEIEWSSYNYDFMYENHERRGQDYEYFMKSIYKYNKALFINAKIYYYKK